MPCIGVVIPVYQQSILIAEAITSIIEQSGDNSAVTIIVNDGCPLKETDFCAKSFAEAHPDKIHYLHTPNGGLSAARNRGVRVLLERYPSIQAIFLLDADNRLESDSFQLFTKLLVRYPERDWFYPQFDMFGLVASKSQGGEWSLLMNSANNFCEAGSLIRRRVFESGVWFDENMKLGYEDWDFWLSAAKKGFRGHATKEPFLQYRKRSESMLTGSLQLDNEIRSYMRRKHQWLYNAKTALYLEDMETPRFRVFFKDDTSILSLTDPYTAPRHLTLESLDNEVWSAITDPSDHDMGACWIFTDLQTWDSLMKYGLVRFVLWELERSLMHGHLFGVFSLKDGGDNQYHYAPGKPGEGAIMAINHTLIRTAICDDNIEWKEELLKKTNPINGSFQSITIKDLCYPIQNNLQDLNDHLSIIISSLRKSQYSESLSMSFAWRQSDFANKDYIHSVARKCAGSGILYPLIRRDKATPSICFLLPIAEFGGVETVALGIAKAMRQKNWHTALCMVGTNPVKLADNAELAFNEIMWFPDPSLFQWGDQVYEGTHLARSPDGEMALDLLGMLGSFDCVLGSHAAGAVSSFGKLKKMGVVTVLHEHVMEVSAWGRIYGPPMIALAHEAAVDIIATCSQQLTDWLHAHGVPQKKLVPVINTAGHLLSEEDRQIILDARRQSWIQSRPLRVLFLGRLDWQKGLDRMVSVIESLGKVTSDIEWRIVGKSVIGGGNLDLLRLRNLVDIEPPVYTPDERSILYAWADIVLLPSRYEGLPLTVFEAQQHGAVPLMTKVGAYNEAIEHNLNGILVSADNCVEEMSEALMWALANRAELCRMSEATSARIRTWDMAAATLMERLESLVALSRKNHQSLNCDSVSV
jgi:glycosyltransferase involved in cell wall biosynthesis